MRKRLLAASVLALAIGTVAGAAMIGYCSPTVIDGRVDSWANPNKFTTSGYYHCINLGTTPCQITERVLITRYAPAMRTWVRVSDTQVHYTLGCDQSTGWVSHDYPVGSGQFEIDFEVINGSDVTGPLIGRWIANQTFP